ncbi:MAG: acetyltransferase [marine bacterium B5-7]|nr:MAG: acetyltransferase [marine bacterium B5-7]
MALLEGFTIRSYESGDRSRLVSLWQKVFPDGPIHNNPDKVIDAKLAMNDDLLLVLTRGKSIIGSVMVGYDGHRGWLYGVAVDPSLQGRGLGQALVERAIDDLRQLGCPKVNLQVRSGNETVVNFYRNLGFEIEERLSLGRRID